MATASFDLALELHIAELRSKLVAEHDVVLGSLLQELKREVSALHQEQVIRRLAPNGRTHDSQESAAPKARISSHEPPPALFASQDLVSTGLIMPPPAITSPAPPCELPVKLVPGEQVEDEMLPIISVDRKDEAEPRPNAFSIAIPGCMHQSEIVKKKWSCDEEECARQQSESASKSVGSAHFQSAASKSHWRQSTHSKGTVRSGKLSQRSRSGGSTRSENFLDVLSQVFSMNASNKSNRDTQTLRSLVPGVPFFSPRPSNCKASSVSPCLLGVTMRARHSNALYPMNHMSVSQGVQMRGHPVNQAHLLSPRPSTGGLLSVYPESDGVSNASPSLRSSIASCASVESRLACNDHGFGRSTLTGRLSSAEREAHKSYEAAKRNRPGPGKANGKALSQIADVSLHDEFNFETLPIWDKSDSMPSLPGYHQNNTGSMDFDDSDSEDEEAKKNNSQMQGKFERCLAHVMVMPMSKRRMLWDFFGCVFIAYDFVVTPLQFFDPPPAEFILVINWMVRIFWSLDLPLSFMTAYSLPVGTIERRPHKVWARYARTWMVCDVTIIAFDWIDLAMESEEGLGAARIGKTFKITRLLRMVRLLRLVKMIKMPDVFTAFTYHLHSERLLIVIGIIKIMIFLIAITHLIACGWFGMGTIGERLNWVKEHDLDRAGLEYKYFTSFHWSMTQFTGSMEVFPHNFPERFYTVITLLFGFLVSASVVSTITSSMTRLQIVSASETTQAATLNQYLLDNGISAKVALRVQRNAVYSVAQEKRNTPESSIELLQFVSEPLRIELHYEIHCPVLTWYPFFRHYNDANRSGMKRICHSTVKTLSITRGDILFSAGELPPLPMMYFVCAGKLQYQKQGHCSESVHSGSRICECVLWTVWVHIGNLRAKTESTLLLLDATQFQATAVQHQTAECYPKKFAKEFVQELNKSRKITLTDMEDIGFSVEGVCEKVFALKRHATVSLT